MSTFFDRLVRDDAGQDLIEYALLTTVVALSVIGVFDLLVNAIATAYGAWNTSANNIWATPDPGGP